MPTYDVVARFLTQRSQFNQVRVKYPAFMPTLGLQTSVCGIDGLTDTDIWSIGEDVAKTRGQALYGRGDIKSNYISEIDLILDIDDTPPRHANIIGWPEKDVEQQQLALKLANQSELKLVPSDPSK